MAIRNPSKRAARRPAARQPINPRVLLLAGVGAVSLGRKQAIRTLEEAGDNVVGLRKRVDASVKQIESRARKLTKQAEGDFRRLRKQAGDQAAALRRQARARVAPLQQSLLDLVDQATVRIAPVLEKAGLVPAPKPVARKPAGKRTARKAA